MNEIQTIQSILSEIAGVFRNSDLASWAKTFQDFYVEIGVEPNAVTRKILSLYGGMGSFNDIVIYRSGIALKKENSYMDALREQLFDLCQLYLSRNS